MDKSEIGDGLAGRSGLNKTKARDAVDGLFEAIREEVRIAGLVIFADRSPPAHVGCNPVTSEVLSISASKVPSFRAARSYWMR